MEEQLLDAALAALLLPLDELDDLVLDETLTLDELPLLPASFPCEQPLDSCTIKSEDATPATPSRQHNVSTNSKKKKKRPAAYDSNSTRNRRRQELAYLRQRVEEMQQELVQVEATTDARQSLWKEIASRQLNERHCAEAENQRLKDTLETQLQVAKSLEALLTQRSTATAMEDCGVGRYMHAFDNEPDKSDVSVFVVLLTSIDEIHADAEWLVRQGGGQADSTLTPSHEARVRPTDHGLLVEIFGTDLLPFSLRASSHAAWQYFSHGKNHLSDRVRHFYERVRPSAVASDANTVLERSGFAMTGNGSKITVKLKQALRRYIEADRVVIAYSAIMEPIEFAGEPLSDGFSLRHWGCMVLRTSTPTDGSAPLTVLQSCMFMTPEFHSGGDDTTVTTDTGKLTECVLSWVSSGLLAWRQRIENILMDHHLDLRTHDEASTTVAVPATDRA